MLRPEPGESPTALVLPRTIPALLSNSESSMPQFIYIMNRVGKVGVAQVPPGNRAELTKNPANPACRNRYTRISGYAPISQKTRHILRIDFVLWPQLKPDQNNMNFTNTDIHV